MKFSLALSAVLVATASAFAPTPFGVNTRSMQLNAEKDPAIYGKFDECVWGLEQKKEVYAEWDPNAPRSPWNFNPFETWEGNSPDPSGWYPGEIRYKDPSRPDMNFALMTEERNFLEDLAKNVKEGNVPGAPGCRN
mmetsp:Transcript_23292/g.48370  ORF Transcript_23292/g.48370 Transcript_23292/m.48370 type:complete len:136 (+) Transcript_23292:53-460(+)|eukprot:CAMPEP_0182463868 /NCGR_PEP_ID=MMETSP1319-20130603/8031_1 /TAXON_ID=172717 /ORGANISM="Bolidomonas pacifica, Strain RCC208" /LENGTH=135 /DNA_ID=CAMNT_0024663457 /DNA_START=22 /DNA_END=429 /DNA_ORIENTATION=+